MECLMSSFQILHTFLENNLFSNANDRNIGTNMSSAHVPRLHDLPVQLQNILWSSAKSEIRINRLDDSYVAPPSISLYK